MVGGYLQVMILCYTRSLKRSIFLTHRFWRHNPDKTNFILGVAKYFSEQGDNQKRMAVASGY
ncbi:hypothetical protein RHMOL_Rhmol12G0041100 [Rhododendron molle]|uniref:Uncharacterized protein n=1 Tax=Rhododendron molle TaxID=49168 RepID=A0ACC0LF45_RHOML|nr:hypothetical protein RHMOL_Rhmol12G0041100 [Rhododendron molle]